MFLVRIAYYNAPISINCSIDAVMYISTKVLLVAASHARTTSDWVINSNCIALAASQLVPVAPITQVSQRKPSLCA